MQDTRYSMGAGPIPVSSFLYPASSIAHHASRTIEVITQAHAEQPTPEEHPMSDNPLLEIERRLMGDVELSDVEVPAQVG